MRTIDNRGDSGEPAGAGLPESEAQKAREYFADLIEGRLDELAATLTELYREALPGYAEVSRSMRHALARPRADLVRVMIIR